MLFSAPTIKIIQTFAKINQGIIFAPGNELVTMAVMRNIFAKAIIPETIPREFAIYDLNEFLSVYSLCSVHSTGKSKPVKINGEKIVPIAEQLQPSTEKMIELMEEREGLSRELASTRLEKETINTRQSIISTAYDKQIATLEKKLAQLDKKLNELTLKQEKQVEEYNKKMSNNPEAGLPVYSDNLEEGINFREEFMFIKGKTGVATYHYSSPSRIISPGNKRIKTFEVDKKFVLTLDDWTKIIKSSKTLKLKDLQISEEGLTLLNRKSIPNKMSIGVDYEQFTGKESVTLEVEHLSKLLPAHYDVEIADRGITHFISRDEKYKVEFLIAFKTDEDW